MKHALIALLMLAATLAGAAPEGDEMARRFADPPREAKPWVYWMWLGGNISKEGITADLEAMARAGVGGALIMDLGVLSGDPSTVDPVLFMTPQWQALVHFAFAEAARLGIEVDMNNDDGWNCGGTWITPAEAMQKLTWSETRVAGPGKFGGTLEQPKTLLETYHDIAVLAVPAAPPAPRGKRTVQAAAPGPWVQFDYAREITARSLTIDIKVPAAAPGAATGNNRPPVRQARPERCELQVSTDGTTFRTVQSFETGWNSMMAAYPSVTLALGEAVRGKSFRLLLPGYPGRLAPWVNFTPLPEARVGQWALKAGSENIREHGGGSPLYSMAGSFPKPGPGMGIAPRSVIDLSGNMKPDGTLEWDAPKGQWTVLRIGYTPTGSKNGMTTPAGQGLDCDKLSKAALEAHLEKGMMDALLKGAAPAEKKSLGWVHDDSWESGICNWTADFRAEFKTRRGYDPIPWLPVMAGGRVVASPEQSERFLWDVRRTLADMLIDNHLKHFRELAHKRGLKFSSESSGRQQFLYDPIAFQMTSDMPMGEFWANELRPRPDCKVAASAAHLMGLPVVGAEAFTGGLGGRWTDTPYSLKTLGDSAFCFGVNQFVFHRMALQRWPERRPGVAWPNIGVNFDSTNTWWEESGDWNRYLARCQWLLRQGRFVGDVAVLTGEGAPNPLIRQLREEAAEGAVAKDTSTITEMMLRRYGQMPALPPPGYDYDGVDPATVLTMSVREGRVTIPGGVSWRVLSLPNEERMTAALARKVKELVGAGAVAIGPKPQGSPSLGDGKQGDEEVRAIAGEVWGDCDGKRATSHAYGKGRVYWGKKAGEVLEELGIEPDFEFAATEKNGSEAPNLDFIHRQEGGADIYFVSNQRTAPAKVECLFRVAGRQPELWFPDTGKVRECPEFAQRGGRTVVPLQFDPAGSMFVVFRKPVEEKKRAAGGARGSNFPELKEIAKLAGPWEVAFDPKWGGPAKTNFSELASWTASTEAGIKYYSGQACYRKSFDVVRLAGVKTPVYLDLGAVKEMARVKVNGKDLGVLWKPPFRVEVSGLLKEKGNNVEITVTNLWVNRLIGDAALPEEKRLARTNWNPYTPESPLLESGLLGPVTVKAE